MKWYLKELVKTPLYLPNGASVPFEDIGGTYGLFKTADPYLIGELDKAIRNHVGGVVALSEEDYNQWLSQKKTSQSSSESPQPHRQEMQPIPFQQLNQLRAAGAAAVGSPILGSPNAAAQQAQQQKVEPLTVPQQFTKPKVGRVPKSAAPAPAPPAAP